MNAYTDIIVLIVRGMVIESLGICDRDGVVLVSRQFTLMARAAVEDAFLSFPKLIKMGQQHTFVQSQKHLFIFSPINTLYLVLICTKESNIIQHAETIKLFYKVLSFICSETIDEESIEKHAVDILLAIDDLVSNGYRESITLQEVQTQLKMDSAQEKIHLALLKQQEQDAKVASQKNKK